MHLTSTYLGFPYFNFLGGGPVKKTPCILAKSFFLNLDFASSHCPLSNNQRPSVARSSLVRPCTPIRWMSAFCFLLNCFPHMWHDRCMCSFMWASNWKISFTISVVQVWNVMTGYLILFCKGLVTSLLGALVVGAVLASQVPPAGAIITTIIITTIEKLIMLMLTMMMWPRSHILCPIYRVFFFTGPPPKKLKYGKLRLGEVTCI